MLKYEVLVKFSCAELRVCELRMLALSKRRGCWFVCCLLVSL